MPANTDPMIIPYGRAVIDSRTDLNKKYMGIHIRKRE